MDAKQFQALIRTPGFWLQFANLTIGMLLTLTLIKQHPDVAQLLAGVGTLLTWVAGQALATWSPPRQVWTPEQRAANGLDPQTQAKENGK